MNGASIKQASSRTQHAEYSNIILKYQELAFLENIPLFILFGYKKNLSLM